MINPDIIFGRLGNRMFQMAFLYSYAKNNDIDYYFQDEFFFRENKEAVRALFSADIPDKTDAVAIHVRRAGNPSHPSEPNYSENPFYVNLFNEGYYQRAMALFPEGTKFLVFSDDIEWCKQQPLFKDCEFFHGTELEDMNKMASCKAQIIANSSFSWWAAWLSPEYPNNRVIAPKQWFADGKERVGIPEHWERI